MQGKVLVYQGEGAGLRSVRSTQQSLERLLAGPLLRPLLATANASKPVQVDTLSAAELLDGGWTQQAALLVMPGGADLPYCKALNGRGNRIIKEFVTSGGSYLGLCAGAYYACARVEFEPGTPLEVVGNRELAFFPGIGRGAAFPGFDYRTEAGAVAAQVEFRVPHNLMPSQQQQPEQQHAGALLSPTPQHAVAAAFDYCNGGPWFTSLDGSSLNLEQLPGITVLAMYCCEASQQQQPQQQQGRVAAVRCSVGQGVAVLCGTHPELGPEWLDPCGESNAAQVPQPHEPAPQPPAAADAGASGEQPQQQHQEGRAVLAGAQQRLAEEAACLDVSSGGSTGSSGMGQSSAPVFCSDVALATHAQQLQQLLLASQSERDLLLSSLLFEALARPHSAGDLGN